MDNKKLAEVMFKDVTLTREDIFNKYPKRQLKEGAKVTRIAPSPTGFVHLGNLYGALVDERLAHQSNGVFYLRIEDTDKKREVENGKETIIKAFNEFGLSFDEGATIDGEKGEYGPYYQRQREDIYKVFAKELVEKGLAYPCFCTAEELEQMHLEQQEKKDNFGYYGDYAIYSKLSSEDAIKKIQEGIPYVVRFRSQGNIINKVKHTDLVKGEMEVTQNDQHVVILKADGIPTYHFAHVIDDYLMGTTHVVRGEEWLATLPMHIELFDTLGLKKPKYLHTAHLMKLDPETGNKRKLSKRKDPELGLSFYHEKGYPVVSVTEYLMTLINSNFEDWRRANPDAPMDNFEFTTKKMSSSGALFDLDKLLDVSKTIISKMSAEEVYDNVCAWAKEYNINFYNVLTQNKEYSISILQIGRGGKKPRKDIAIWSEVEEYMGFMFDETFKPNYELPKNLKEDAVNILKDYINLYNENHDQSEWFNTIKNLAPKYGFASEIKEYKQNPDNYKGHCGDISTAIRVAVCGRQNSPDMYTLFKIMGKEKIIERINIAINAL